MNYLVKKQANIILIFVSSIYFLAYLDLSLMNGNLSAILGTFGTSNITYLNVPILSFILGGTFVFLFNSIIFRNSNKRSLLQIGILLFIVASFSCYYVENMFIFTFLRFLQGIGITLAIVTGSSILYSITTTGNTVSINSWLNIPTLIGFAVGPVLPIYFSDWQLSFVFIATVGCLLLLTSFILPAKSQNKKNNYRFNLYELMLFGSIILSLSIILGGDIVSKKIKINFFILFLSAVLIYYFCYYNSSSYKSYFVHKSFFKIRNYKLGIIYNIIFRLTFCCTAILIITQNSSFYSSSGLLLTFFALGSIASKLSLKNLIEKYPLKFLLKVTALLTILSGFSLLYRTNILSILFVLFFLNGFIVSTFYTVANSICFKHNNKDLKEGLDSFLTIIQQLTLGFGITIGLCSIKYLNSILKSSLYAQIIFLFFASIFVLVVISFNLERRTLKT